MAWHEKPPPASLDEQPLTGLAARDTTLPHPPDGPERLTEQQPPLLVFPSGAAFPLCKNQDAHTPPQVQLAPVLTLPLHHTRDQGYHWACLAEQANGNPASHYHIHKSGEDGLEIRADDRADHFLIRYDNAAGQLRDIVAIEEERLSAGEKQPSDAVVFVPNSEVGQRPAAPANGSSYTDNDTFAPLMHWLEPLVAHILWQSKTVAGYIPPTLIADAMQEGFLKLWQRLHDEPGFIEANTKSYIAQWVAWQGKDRLLYGNGHKRWARHTVSTDALQHHLLASGTLDDDRNDKLDMLTDAVGPADLVNQFSGEVNGHAPANARQHRYPVWTLAVENRIDLNQAITTLADRYLAAGDDVRLFALVSVTTTSSTRSMAEVLNMPYHTFRKRVGQVRAELRALLSALPQQPSGREDAPQAASSEPGVSKPR